MTGSRGNDGKCGVPCGFRHYGQSVDFGVDPGCGDSIAVGTRPVDSRLRGNDGNDGNDGKCGVPCGLRHYGQSADCGVDPGCGDSIAVGVRPVDSRFRGNDGKSRE